MRALHVFSTRFLIRFFLDGSWKILSFQYANDKNKALTTKKVTCRHFKVLQYLPKLCYVSYFSTL